jgi:RND family efflux transporter MFP subunit
MAGPTTPWRRVPLTALFLLAGVATGGCGERNAYVPPPPPDVKVAVPVVKPLTVYAEFTGTTQASKMVEIRAQVQGYLDSIHFTDGADVKKDDQLFVIDPRPYQAKVDQAKADLESNKAQAIRTEAIYNRTLVLAQSKAAAKQDVETSRGDWEVAKAGVLQAQAKLKEAELNLSYTDIKAPINGRIGRHLVDIGNLVQPNSTLLTTIAAYDPMFVYFTVSEVQHLNYLKRQRANQSADPAANKRHPVEIGLANEDGYPHHGYIDFADNTIDPTSGTITIRGTFDNPAPYVLEPGLFVRIRVPTGVLEQALLVPERALGQDQGGQYLLIVNKENVVEHRPVKVGAGAEGGLRVIEQGLQAGERFVVEGLQKARPGSKINPK